LPGPAPVYGLAPTSRTMTKNLIRFIYFS